MSGLTLALLVAAPLVSAINLPRQASATASASADLEDLLVSCVLPSSIPSPTGEPDLPDGPFSYLASATPSATSFNACALNSAPSSISSEYASYTSAYSAWVSSNSGAISSYFSSVYNYQQTAKTSSQCTSLYSVASASSIPYVLTASTVASSDLFPTELFCSTGASSGVAASTAASASASASASAAGSSAMTSGASGSTTGTTVSASVTVAAAASTSSSAAAPGMRASAYIDNMAIYLGGSIAISAFIGMIAL